MYIHLTYYSGDRSLIENIGKIQHADITGDKVFFLDAVDNDGRSSVDRQWRKFRQS